MGEEERPQMIRLPQTLLPRTLLALGALAFGLTAGCHAPAPRAADPPPASQAAASPPTLRFRDVAQAAGLRYRWSIPGPRPLDILQTIGNGCAFLDYDGDGNLDILLVGPKLALYRGDGRGHFTDVTHETGLDKFHGHFLGCAVGDYDNDGFDDIYISGYRTALLLHNDGGKRFTDVTRQAGLPPEPWGTSAAWADIDGDGRLDLYVGNYVVFNGKTPRLCPSNRVPAGCSPGAYRPLRGVLYRNLGRGRFRDVTTALHADKVSGFNLGAAFADYDGSGRQSLALANDETNADLLENTGRGFVNVAKAAGTALNSRGSVVAGMGIDWGDYDNDGRLDLFMAAFEHQSKCVFHNDGGAFSDRGAALGLDGATPWVTFGAKWADFDNDGWLDLMLANGHVLDNVAAVNATLNNIHMPGFPVHPVYRQPTEVFRNLRGARFADDSAGLDAGARRPLVGRGLAVGDYDNDGRMDALVVDSEGAPLLLHNETPHPGHWLTLRLIGTRCSRDALGALVTATAGGQTQVRQCQTDGSYLSASDKRVHLGLGRARTAALTIRWPDGHTQSLGPLAADRVVTVRED